jgi:uncharacterized protein (DUF2235 family)
MPRDIAVFIDGTWNQQRRGGTTNVLKLCEATRSGVVGDRVQVKLYISGVGTKPVATGEGLVDADYRAQLDLHLSQELPVGLGGTRRVIGGAFGKGTSSRIKAAYHAICAEYDRKRGDRVFLFGFSRGAFAVRSLSGFTYFIAVSQR